ncbi:uncharacterized protein LOC122010469 [Zingiber officinale]|uniref:uncharacterized protein LOC122010469 n=1 Tax=Zingiber officinale TaxID=94328 RepID=UPI001C4C22A3|nr:uncharacterized protein LOC122010469 [Zingiber officinale]
MEEDFNEADVLWPDTATRDAAERNESPDSPPPSRARRTPPPPGPRVMVSSCPVNIPAPSRRSSELGHASDDDDYPPHVMVEMRDAATSLTTPGSTVRREKGRRLCRVRNLVLQMTGFIER